MKRRLAMLATLARVDDRRMRDAAADLVPLQDRLSRLAQEAAELERRRQQEGSVSAVEAMPYVGRFLTTLRRETDRIRAERVAVEQAAEVKRAQVLDAWKDLRPKERLQAALRDQVRQDLLQAEQHSADETASQSHARRSLSRRRAALD